MPATYVQNQGNQNLRQRSLFNLNSYSKALHRDAHNADNVREYSQKACVELNRLEIENSKFVTSSSSQITRYYITVIIILAVYFIDTLLFGGVASLLAKSAFPNNNLMHYVIKVITPLAFLAVEIYLALLIYEKNQSVPHFMLYKKGVNLWMILGIVFALVMPVLVISSHPDTVRFIIGLTQLNSYLIKIKNESAKSN